MSEMELRELDAWIAEHVMGWRRKTWAEYWPDQDWSDYKEGYSSELTPWWHGKDGTRDVDGECDCGEHDTGWIPTTKSEDAMEVLKKCCITLAVNVNIWRAGSGLWYCNLPTGGKNYGEAETLELAICLFAKKLFSK